jgi:hypothetical protein
MKLSLTSSNTLHVLRSQQSHFNFHHFSLGRLNGSSDTEILEICLCRGYKVIGLLKRSEMSISCEIHTLSYISYFVNLW